MFSAPAISRMAGFARSLEVSAVRSCRPSEAKSTKRPAPRFQLRRGTTIEILSDGVTLFCPHGQLIHRLNVSSAALAFALENGATLTALTAELTRLEVDPLAARDWVAAFMVELARLRLLEVKLPEVRLTDYSTQNIRVAGVVLALRYSSRDLLAVIGPAFAHLESAASDVSASYHLSDNADFVFISKDGGPALVVGRQEAAVQIKGMILDQILSQADHLVALHSACLTGPGGALLLLGPPGAGKTTLALALMNERHLLGSDDVTLVRRDGTVDGIPLAPGAKEFAWDLVEASGRELSESPAHLRPDGQWVRYLRLHREELATAGPVAAIVRLRRSPGRDAAMAPMASSDALAELLREAVAPNARCSVQIVRALANIIRGAACFELHYSEAGDAIPYLRHLTAND